MRNFRVNVKTNQMDADTIVAVTREGFNSALSVVIPAGETGIFEDLDSIINVKTDKNINIEVDATASSAAKLIELDTSIVYTQDF